VTGISNAESLRCPVTDWAPAEVGDRHACRFLDWCRVKSQVLPLHAPKDI
jgi:hypothetical protein